MKILHVAYKSEITGGEVVLWDLARAAQAAGHEVHVVAPTPGPLLDALAEERMQVAAIPLGQIWRVGGVLQLRRYLRDQDIDIVQSHGLLPNIHARLAAKPLAAVRQISTIHLALELASGGRGVGWCEQTKARLYRAADNWTAQYSKRIVCVSEYVRQDQLAQGISENKLVTIRNGIDVARFSFLESFDRAAVRARLGVPEDAPLVGTIARHAPQKDLVTLIRAMPTVWESLPKAHLVLIGDGPLRGDLEALASLLGGAGRIHFAGYRADARECLAAFDVFALPSLHEGLPLVVLEAMACSLPVVCTPVPGTLEAVTPDVTAWVTPFGDAGAMGGAICELLIDSTARARMGQAGRVLLETEFTSERMARETLALYETVMGEP